MQFLCKKSPVLALQYAYTFTSIYNKLPKTYFIPNVIAVNTVVFDKNGITKILIFLPVIKKKKKNSSYSILIKFFKIKAMKGV